jgi:hypothetical protein
MIWIRAGTEAAVLVTLGVALHVMPPARAIRERFIAWPPLAQGLAYSAATVAAFFLAPASERFIYFQF